VNPQRVAKVDFHLHSHASNVTDYYAANAFAIPESYSDPHALYPLLKGRGMHLVTLTDHNSIDGVRELLHRGLPDVFISSELTATFPEDGCNIHVTVANVTEAQFTEANRLRGNVYELVAYLEAEVREERRRAEGNRIAYFMTHPLMSTQNRPYGREGALSLAHIEKALLLFNAFEGQNGSRTRALNELTQGVLGRLDAPTLARLADRHGIEPRGDHPWHKAMLAGSDDHAGINPGHTWTEFPYAGERPTANELVLAIRRRETRLAGAHGGPIGLAHSVLKLLYDGGKVAPTGGRKAVTVGGPIRTLLQLVFDDDPTSPAERALRLGRGMLRRALARAQGRYTGGGVPFEALLEAEADTLLGDAGFRARLASVDRTDDRIFLVVNTLLNRIFARYVNNLRGAQASDVVGVIKEIVALVSSNLFVSLPYLMSFMQQSADSLVSRDVRRAFDLQERQRVVLVTDTFFEVNGVSLSIRRMIRESVRRDLDFTVVTCASPREREFATRDAETRRWLEEGRLKLFESVAQLDFPEYDDLQVRFPPFLELLQFLQSSGCTKIQISTPGVVGLAGLAAGKALQVETAATYHTSIPEYVENYTRDISLEALAWRYMILFYHAVDEVLVPSRFIAKLLHKRGLRNRKLLILDRWVDDARFHPRHRTPGFWARFGVAREDAVVKFIYVGRLGVEKNLALLAEAYRALRRTRPDCHLILVGDGPYREALEATLKDLPATFTGFLHGDELSRAIASADVKVFPSTTDTWGNAPLEAQASGLPVIVSEVGGPRELMVDGVTGVVVNGRDAGELAEAMRGLMDPSRRATMGAAARAYVEAHRVQDPFTAVLDAAAYRKQLAEERARGKDSPRVLDAPPEVVDAFEGLGPVGLA
jgi:glycosyltransferase involved in cell wall biosynthesis